MKTSILILGLFCALISSQAAEAPPPQLVGVAEFGGKQLALIEVPPKQSWQTADLLALMPGQKDGEIELLKVDPSAGSAAISLGGK